MSVLDGLLFGCGDATLGVNPARDSVASTGRILHALHDLLEYLGLPTQTCVLAHIGTQLAALRSGAPVDLLFQSIAGTEAANDSFGISIAQSFRGNILKRFAESQLVVDEAWALAGGGTKRFDRRVFLVVGLMLWVAWTGGTAVGALLGSAIGDPSAARSPRITP